MTLQPPLVAPWPGVVRSQAECRLQSRTGTGQGADGSVSNAPVLRAASVAACGGALVFAADALTQPEKARWDRFLRQDDRDRFLLGRILVRSMLAEVFGIEHGHCELEPDAWGKPRLQARPDIAVSIAHSGDVVLAGVGAGILLGVDVERHRSDVEWEGVGRLVFTRSERHALLDLPGDQRMAGFFRQWTLKEALAKALGTGLMRDPRRFAIDQASEPLQPTFVGDSPDDVGHGWTLSGVDISEGYSAAMAWRPCIERDLIEPSRQRG